MNVLIADKFPENRVEEIKALGVEVTYDPTLGAADLVAAVKGVNVLVVRSTQVTAEAIQAGGTLSLIIRAGAGVNTIDCAAASERGTYVANCPGKNSVAVAELAMGLICALDRRLPDNVADLRAGQWNKAEYSKADGLLGKTLGVVGVGMIGREVIARAKAFGLAVVAWSRSLTPEKAEALGVGFCATLDDLVPRCDIISLHLAQTAETKGLFSADLIGKMKDGAWLVNTARAGVVDEDALLAAVEAGRIRVGLDVVSDEPEGKTGPWSCRFKDLPGAYVTHHIGASTNQAQDAVAEETIRVLRTYMETGLVENWVNRCATTPAHWQLVVRHFDRPGVLANVLTEIKSADLNAEEITNVIFEGARAACCTIQLDKKPTDDTMAAIRARADEVISAELVDLTK